MNLPVKTKKEQHHLIASQIKKHGYVIVQNFIPKDVLNALQTRIQSLNKEELTQANIGRGVAHHSNQDIRRDVICWLDKNNQTDNIWLTEMDELKAYLNQTLFLGLFDYESHYAIYQEGDFYKKHIDALKGESNRILSSVFYLNEQWESKDGGELIIYNKNDEIIKTIQPQEGTLVLFLSEEFPHEVLASNRKRYSIAGWFRVNSSSSINIDPFQ